MKVVVRTCALRCAMCHDDLDATPVECALCRTVTHAECSGPCPTLGCRGRPVLHPREPTYLEWLRSTVRRYVRVRPTTADWIVSLAVVGVGVIAALPAHVHGGAVNTSDEEGAPERVGTLRARAYMIVTAGPDGRFGTADDQSSDALDPP